MLPALAGSAADRPSFTMMTTLRLLFRPTAESNLISQRIARGRPLLPDRMRHWINALLSPWLLVAVLATIPLLGALWVFSPVVLAVAAAILTLREVHAGMLDQVSTTLLPEHEVVRGLVGGTLTRLGAWRKMTAVIVPVLVLIIGGSMAPLMMVVGGVERVLKAAAVLTALMVGISGLSVTGAAVGMLAVLRWRDSGVMALAASAMALITGLEIAAAVLASSIEGMGVLVLLALMIFPYQLAAVAMNQARRWVRVSARQV